MVSANEVRRILAEVADGKATDLGGGVFKKRLNKNELRSIIIAKSEDYWVLEFLFAKSDADTITEAALDGFRTLADTYSNLKPSQLKKLLENGDLEEIFHESNK